MTRPILVDRTPTGGRFARPGRAPRSLHIQLWSSNYAPEPTGIAPLSATWAQAMLERGHRVDVVAAHPHYPLPIWGSRRRPYREVIDGVNVLRLPLWIGHDSTLQRMRQELAYTACLSAALPALGRPDAIVAVSPSFPALMPAMLDARARRIPWTLWLQDILPDGAATTGLIRSGPLLTALRRLERMAYRSAWEIFVISEAFRRNLLEKGVPEQKVTRIYNPSAVSVGAYRAPEPPPGPARLLVMGNIGHSQGLAEFVAALEQGDLLGVACAQLRIAGAGVAESDVRAEIRSENVELLGLLLGDEMERELRTATLGIVTQRSDILEFNLPSKLMNYMAHSLPVLAVVNPDSECARIVAESGAGWVLDSGRPDQLHRVLHEILSRPGELLARGRAAHAYAERHFAPERVVERFEERLLTMVPAMEDA
jgi:colanic acid biosynthesis glycosyl transferase WcaI